MHLLLVCPFSHGANVSPELVMAGMLAKRGHSVHFLTIESPYIKLGESSPPLAMPKDVAMYLVENHFLIPSLAYPFVNPLRVSAIVTDIIRNHDIELVHFFFPEHLTSLPLLCRFGLRDMPIVLSVNGVPGYTWRYGLWLVDIIGKCYSRLVVSREMKNADVLIPFSSQVRRHLLAEGIRSDRVTNMIVHGVSTDLFRPSDEKAELRVRYGLPANSFVIAFSGRLARVKRLDVVLEALAVVRRSHPNVLLIVAGDGPERKSLEVLASQHCPGMCRFIGFVHQETVRELYVASDMLVLTSTGEGLPSALLEACSSGLPMLVSDVGGNADIVKDSYNGIVLNEVTANTVAAGIHKVMSNLGQMSANARHYALEHLGWERIIDEYVAIYQSAIENKR